MEGSDDPMYYLSNGQRKIMRLFVVSDDTRVSMDIPVGASVKEIKSLIVKAFNITINNVLPGDEAQLKRILVLNYSGAELPDHWILSDLSISPGSTLKTYIKAQTDPVLYFYTSYNNETVPVQEKLKLMNLGVADLRALASRKTGLPISVFRMVSSNDKDMYDCHTVDTYNIKPGDTIRIETWDGWNEFLKLSSLGFTTHVLEKISKDDEVLARYQMKVAMYIAAHFGHVDLALSICRRGIKPDEPVGHHPWRQWCSTEQHVDTLKAPIHESVEFGQLGVLRGFTHQNITSILSKDGNGLQPLNIALRKKMKNCASFLLTKQWSRVPYNGSSIPLVIYSRLKAWCEKAKEKVGLLPGLEKSKFKIIRNFPLLGQGVYVDGYSEDQISSRETSLPKSTYADHFIDLYYQNLYGLNTDNLANSFDHSNKSRQWMQMGNKGAFIRKRLSSVSSDISFDFDSETVRAQVPRLALGRRGSMRSRSSSIQSNFPDLLTSNPKFARKKLPPLQSEKVIITKNKTEAAFPLPLRSVEDTPRPHYYVGLGQRDEISEILDLYYNKRGIEPRTHAIQCLSITNKLKEKPWLAQVRIAMKVSKESVKKSLGKLPSPVAT